MTPLTGPVLLISIELHRPFYSVQLVHLANEGLPL